MNRLAMPSPAINHSALPSYEKIQWVVPPKSILDKHNARAAWEQRTATEMDAVVYPVGPNAVVDAITCSENATSASEVDATVHSVCDNVNT